MREALLIVDVQNDFCTGGALAVPGSDAVVRALNRHIEATHFAAFGEEWPVHCVEGSPGARFHPDLRLPDDTIVVTKGQRPDSAGYSMFDGQTAAGTAFLDDLLRRGVTHLRVGGLATDYCGRHSVIDALDAGLSVTVLADAIAGVDVHPGDSGRAVTEMRERGAEII